MSKQRLNFNENKINKYKKPVNNNRFKGAPTYKIIYLLFTFA